MDQSCDKAYDVVVQQCEAFQKDIKESKNTIATLKHQRMREQTISDEVLQVKQQLLETKQKKEQENSKLKATYHCVIRKCNQLKESMKTAREAKLQQQQELNERVTVFQQKRTKLVSQMDVLNQNAEEAGRMCTNKSIQARTKDIQQENARLKSQIANERAKRTSSDSKTKENAAVKALLEKQLRIARQNIILLLDAKQDTDRKLEIAKAEVKQQDDPDEITQQLVDKAVQEELPECLKKIAQSCQAVLIRGNYD